MKKSLLLVVAILFFLVVTIVLGFEEVYDVIGRMSIFQLFAMTALQLCTLFLTSFIWYYLLKQKSNQVSLSNVFGINLAGSFVESVTPSVKVGGEALKVYLMQKETSLKYTEITAITLVSKFISLFPFLIISFFTLCIAFISFDLPLFVLLAFFGLLLFFSLFFVIFNFEGSFLGRSFSKLEQTERPVLKKIKEKVNKTQVFLEETSIKSKTVVTDYRKRLLLFSIAFIVWAFYPVKVYLVARILGFQLSPVIVIIATFTAYLVSMVPLLPGGLATFEGTLALILAYEGLAPHEAFSIAIMTRVITFWIPLLVSVVPAIYYIGKTKDKTESERRWLRW
ncbi:lysylphosphatidylglycerol synthase transmembrane domain-containing protein [Proteinivorax hydrogeniformans]|uniref:Phosphatidylglycerol lysyltransferase n=1 Tax=Proteinivorax hydrogeniformans TaxID=1826727 RepID=A0AAU8HV96_9FIRM